MRKSVIIITAKKQYMQHERNALNLLEVSNKNTGIMPTEDIHMVMLHISGKVRQPIDKNSWEKWFSCGTLKLQDFYMKFLLYFCCTVSDARVTRGGGGLPCRFLKIGKKCHNLEKNYPDCGHLWLQFFI